MLKFPWFRSLSSASIIGVNPGRNAPRARRRHKRSASGFCRFERLEERLVLSFDMTLSLAATAGVTRTVVVTTATYEATATGANVSWVDVGTDMAAGLDVVITSGITGTEAGNITDLTSNIALANAAGTSLTIQSGTGVGLVGNIALNSIRLNGANSSIIVNAANSINTGILDSSGGGQLASAALTATNGAVNGGSAVAANLEITANTGIGTLAIPFVTQTSNFEAETDTGGIFVFNVGAITIGGVTSALDGLNVITSGDLSISATGSITLADTDGSQIVAGGQTSGNVSLTANGVAADVSATVDRDAITVPAGSITVIADRDILFGTAGADFDNDVRANGSITLTAGSNVTIDGFSDVSSDDFGNSTGGGLTVTSGTVGGGNINITNSFGDDASLGASGSGGGSVVLNAGANGFVNMTSPFSDALFSSSGNVTIDADGVVISAASGITASSGIVTIQQASLDRSIDLGSLTDAAAKLELSDAELDRITASTLRIGRTNTLFPANISITASITELGSGYTTLSLRAGGGFIVESALGTIAVTNLAAVGVSINLNSSGNAIGTFAARGSSIGSNVVSVSNTGSLIVGTVDGVVGIQTTLNGGILLTSALDGASLTVNEAVTSGTGILANVTLSFDDITINAAVRAGPLVGSTQAVILQPDASGFRSISLGGEVVGQLSLTDTELNQITASLLRVGNASNTTSITLVASIAPGNVDTLSLNAGLGAISEITVGEQADITVDNLALHAATGIGSADDLDIAITNLAFSNTILGEVLVTNSGALTINSVDDLATSSNVGGSVTLIASSPVTFAVNTTSFTTLTATSTDSAGTGDDLTVNSGVTLQSQAGAIVLQAGDNLVLSSGSNLLAATTVTLAADFGDTDPGVGTTITLSGTMTAPAGVQVNGGSDADIIQLNSITATTSVSAGDGTDSISLGDGVSLLGGTLDGGADTDTLDYSAYTTTVAVNLGANAPGLTATLGGDQQFPAINTTATGTATLTYNLAAKTFDINLTASGIDPATVTGFHIHRAPFGVNGPIIVDLVGVAPLVPVGDGFTFTATNVAFPVAHEAAFLGGITYLNIHTPTFPAGIIRGQIFSSGLFVAETGTATGTAGVTGIENVVGGTGDDSLVGDNNVNSLQGGAGNDTLVGLRSNDTLAGGTGTDILAWNNGDGTDVMDGGTDSDTVQVNGNLTVDDVFTIAAGAGGRVGFDRTSPAPFSLDIGTTEKLTVVGIGGNDSFSVNSLIGVADLTEISLNGLAGNDTFTVVPSATVAIAANGHAPVPPTTPGDTLTLDLTDVTGTTLTDTLDAFGHKGSFAFSNRQAVSFSNLETIPLPVISIGDATVTEGNTGTVAASFPVTLSFAVSQVVPVNFSTADGTATAAGGDFAAVAGGVFNIAPLTTSQNLVIQVNGDTRDETDQTFFVNLTGATLATINDDQALGTILDDDSHMFRLYNPNADLHVYTISRAEFDFLISLGYHDETTALAGFTVSTVSLPGSLPVHRLYNPNGGQHYITTSDGDRDFLVTQGWVIEPDQGFIFPTTVAPATEIFHLYNNNTGNHLFTQSTSERDAVLAIPTAPPPWSLHASLGFAFASSAASATPTPPEAATAADDERPMQMTASTSETDTETTVPIAVASKDSTNDPSFAAESNSDEPTTIVDSPAETDEQASIAELDAVWSEFGSDLIEVLI